MRAPEPGTVYLVGAGPGNPDLLTLRAHRLLSTADAVFHDDLVPAGILALCRQDARVVSVGKRCGAKAVTQEQIQELLIAASRAGRSVVRLKSGDPLLYGRASEEIAALAEAGIPCEVVPGVSALFAAAADLHVSLTDRSSASKLIVLTGHRADPHAPVWHGDLPQDATVAVYMPGSDYKRIADSLLAAGAPPNVPCAVVSGAGSGQAQSIQTKLGALHHYNPLPAPAVLLAGRALLRVKASTVDEAALDRRTVDDAALAASL